MIYSYQGKENPHPGATGQKGEHGHAGFWFFGSEFKEIGGHSQQIDDVLKEITEYVKNKDSRKILFVFDGVQFLEQANKPDNGGNIWATWLYYCTKSEIKKCEVHFVATHADQVNGLAEKIRSSVKKANEQYVNWGCGEMRYEASRFEEPYFHCIDAKKYDVVKDLLDKIRK